MDIENLKRKYVKDLEENFLPFWEKAIDKEYGGIFTCFTNKGDKKISDRKYIWSQGRFLWLCSNLLNLKDKGIIHLSDQWNDVMDQTYHFLTEHALMANNHVVFAVEKDGSKIKEQMDTSIFADCFYVLGCNAYAQYKNDIEAFGNSLIIYNEIKKRINNNEYKSEPYPIPNGYRSHSIPMILLNVSQELYETALIMDHKSKESLAMDSRRLLKEITDEFSDTNRIKEMYTSNSSHDKTLLERHVNPGHTLESVWFMIHGIEQLKIGNYDRYVTHLAALSRNALSFGWDSVYGGLFRYVDKEGGPPKGDKIETPYEALITDTWDTKLWWPHAEALYTCLLLFYETKDQAWIKWYEKIEEYVFNTFPNTNKEIGEWIQIRDRKGDPLQKVVALPVKDPFHIIRSYILIINLLEGNQAHATRDK